MSSRIESPRSLGKAGIVGSLVAAFAALAVAAPSALGDQVIASSGPLTQIFLNSDLSCQAAYSGDADGEFYSGDIGVTPNGACGTFLSWDGTSYGPNVDAGNPRIDFNQVSQTGVTGSGTSADPYKVVTVVDIEEEGDVQVEAAPSQGRVLLTITQTDTYVVGDEFYRSDIEVRNDGVDGTVNATLYHAGDCFLQNTDDGFGFFDASQGGIYCSANPNNSPFGRIEGFVPLSEGSHYFEAEFEQVWNAIDSAGTQLPDSVDTNGDPANPGTAEDNGAGLSWLLTIEPGTSVTRSLLTRFSPTGGAPPATIAQQPPSQCKLRISRARVFLFRKHPRLRLVAGYRSADPADVLINFIAVQGGDKVNLGDVTRHFRRHGLFRLREELSQQQADTLWHTDRFIVHFKIPGEPGVCARKYTKELTAPRIIDGQRVVFQSDSSFSGGPGHPEH